MGRPKQARAAELPFFSVGTKTKISPVNVYSDINLVELHMVDSNDGREIILSLTPEQAKDLSRWLLRED